MHRVIQCIVVMVVLGFGVGTLGSATQQRHQLSPAQPLAPSFLPSLSAHVSLPKSVDGATSEARVAPPVEDLKGNPTQVVPGQSAESSSQGVPCSAIGCFSSSTNENEDCAEFAVDTLNGGCVAGGWLKTTPLIPFQVMCGQSWAALDGNGFYTTDVDWYLATGIQEDSLTWYITAEFDFDYEVWLYPCNGGLQARSGSGSACDTVVFSYRTISSSPVTVKIVPSASAHASMPCNLGPWNYHIWFIPNCDVNCPPGSVNEGEGCSADPSIDHFNGGCFSSPEVYSTIIPGQPVCGLMSSNGFSRDTDWYRTASALAVGDVVSWRVSAEFPHAIYIIDQRRGCFTRQVASALGDPCATSTAEWKVDSAGVYCFVLGALQSDYGYPCAEGPWKYTASLELCTFGCLSGGTPEGEVCDEYGTNSNDCYNPRSIALGERICGQAWRGQLPGCDPDPGYFCEIFRDTDWYVYDATAGEVLTWTVRASFGVDIAVFELPPGPFGCEDVWFFPTWSFDVCRPVSVTYQALDDGPVIFYVAPVNPGTRDPEYTCDDGPWEYEAIIERAACDCDCAHDPQCNGESDILDVAEVVNVAFRNDPAILDPNAACPWATTDVDCSGVTDILDVALIVNVAFRNGNPATEFCNPCP